MAITNKEVAALAAAFHDITMIKKGTAAEQAAYFLYPDSRIFVLHGEDLTFQANYEVHQKLTDERHWTVGTWDITPLSDNPERARAVGTVYWQARIVGKPADQLIKAYLFEEWIVQRMPSGELKIVVFMNANHSFLPGSAAIDI
jgi:hypothetical protein